MLFRKIKHLTIKDAIKVEESDSQFFALKNLFLELKKTEKKDKNIETFYLFLIICNSLICYQLSWTWEKYWAEFSLEVWKNKFEKLDDIFDFFEKFIPNSKNNKRFVKVKLNRLKKIKSFFEEFSWKEKFFYENMLFLRDVLAKKMKQKKDAKTIVFAVKMFSYWARNIFPFQQFPDEIPIPVDSRITNLFEKYDDWKFENIYDFYEDLSKRLKIPQLHLDAILWVGYEDLIE